MSTFKVDNIQSSNTSPSVFKNVNGTEIGQLTRAWGKLSSSPSFAGSFNVSSITNISSGYYSITLTNAMIDSNYAVTMTHSDTPTVLRTVCMDAGTAYTTTVFRFYTVNSSTGATLAIAGNLGFSLVR